MRDSILVPPNTTVEVNANNPGLFHCHNLFHMVAGMFAAVIYDGFS
jgi:FtsP/CotA-like multicopper oxidase with cupredoxin domain